MINNKNKKILRKLLFMLKIFNKITYDIKVLIK